jgi:hypothetical protein
MDCIGWSRAMKRQYKVMLVVGAVVVVGVLFLAFQNGPTYDPARVHPRLRDLREPYQSIRACFFLDGGSIGIKIVDRDGHREDFAIRAHLGDKDSYTRVFVGALHDQSPDAVEISDPEHTRRMLTRIIADRPDRSAYDDADVLLLRRYPKDYIRVLWHRWCGHYDNEDEGNRAR